MTGHKDYESDNQINKKTIKERKYKYDDPHPCHVCSGFGYIETRIGEMYPCRNCWGDGIEYYD